MKPPIFIAGLPRSGTTWIANVLRSAPGVAYYHEPFNFANVPESVPFSLRYIRASDNDPAFEAYCRRCFAGNQRHKAVISGQRWWRRFLLFPTGRVMIKDVHSLLALDWIQHHIGPQTVLMLRHPFAVTQSWVRHGWNNEGMYARLLEQREAFEDFLPPFEQHLRAMQDEYFSRLGAYWGACCYIALEYQKRHPGWIVIRHEDFLDDPATQFRSLCEKLGLEFDRNVQEKLRRSNASGSDEPFVVRRRLEDEKKKLRRLTSEQMQLVAAAVAPFGITAYSLDH